MRYWSLSFLVLIGFNLFVWYEVLTGALTSLNLYFLKVGQGDSELIVLPGGVKLLIDGGPNKEALFSLSQVIHPTNRYLDLVVITHPQTDHFGGLSHVIERYKVGAFIATGREGESEAWEDFKNLLKTEEIPIILVSEGDKIRYKDNLITVLSPNEELSQSKEVNDSSIVLNLESEGTRTLFTGDAGFRVEHYLTDNYDLDIDILKVGHHGSRYSTGASFLEETTPAISVIEVGKNRYGHPNEVVLERLRSFGSLIYRTDQNGTIELKVQDGKIAIFPET